MDNDNVFWVSSRNGLNQFDGEKIKVYNPNQINTSLDPNITSKIFEDKTGKKWFTSNNAIIELDQETSNLFAYQFEEHENSYHYAFYLENDSLLWLTIGNQLFTTNVLDRPLSLIPLHRYSGFITYPILDKSGKVKKLIRPLVYFGSGIEILNYQQDRQPKLDSFFLSTKKQNEPGRDTVIFYIDIENDTSIWIPSSIGLIHFNPSNPSGRKIYSHVDDKNEIVGYRDAATWKKDYLWIITNDGQLLLFDKKKEAFIRKQNHFLVENQVRTFDTFNNLYIDKWENLWISSFNVGIIHTNLRNNKFSQLLPLGSILINEDLRINSIIEEQNGFIIAGREEGVFNLKMDQFGSYEIKQLLLGCCDKKTIYSIQKDKVGKYWIVDNNKITRWDRENNIFEFELNVPRYTDHIIPISKEEYIISGLHHVFYLNTKMPISQTNLLKDTIPHVKLCAKTFYDEKRELLFISQNDNTLRIVNARPPFSEVITLKKIGLTNGFFRSGYGDFIWIATSTGLYKYSYPNKTVKRIGGDSQDMNQSFVSVVEASQNELWIGSYWGLHRYNLKNDKLDNFTQSDGLVTMQYRENVQFKGKNGSIYFGGNNGITTLKPGQVFLNTNSPYIQLDAVKLNGLNYSVASFLSKKKPLQFSFRENSLEFEFSIIEYSDPHLNSFKYYLIRNDKDTISSGITRTVTLPDLRPGIYKLIGFAKNSDQVEVEDPVIISFTINLPWFKKRWFILLTISLITFVLYHLYLLRIRRIQKIETQKRKEAEFKQKEAEFRQKEAEFKQLAAETETAVLRLQMNPHFIFNSMNAINAFIIKNDLTRANEYLQLFSKLMRTILERSEDTYTDIFDETELLELYLETEAIRLGKKLDYEFEIDQQIDPEEYLLPTMILQPFVENAIWHGLSPKKEGGKIRISFKLENNSLLCEVEDNGVGRTFHTKNRNTSHKSKALEITKRRLKILSDKESQETKMNIIDLYDERNQPLGTKITLILPIID